MMPVNDNQDRPLFAGIFSEDAKRMAREFDLPPGSIVWQPSGITVSEPQARALTAAGDLVTQMWGDLAMGETITLDAFNERLREAGLTERHDGVDVIAQALVDAVVDVDVALGRAEGDHPVSEPWVDDICDALSKSGWESQLPP